MLKNVAWTLAAFSMAVFIAGCAGNPIIDEPNGREISGIFESSPSDSDIMNEVLLSLNEEASEPDYIKAGTKLAIFIKDYPQSKWIGCARALMRTIDKLLVLQEKVKTQSLALDQESDKKDKLRKDYQFSEKQCRAEINQLQQENEQLKKDIMLLKKLEIQLDRREKMVK